MRDPWYYSRGVLASHYLKVMESGLVKRIALFAPRRKGKTSFILNDLSPRAVKHNYVPVFASLWRVPDRPHVAIQEGLRQAVEVLERRRIPWTAYLSRLASVGVQAGGIGGSLKLGPARTQRPSPDEIAAMNQGFRELIRITEKKRRTILLLIDEAQHLATRQTFDAVAKALRTAIEGVETTRPDAIRTVFTGSSRTDLAALLHKPTAAFYQSFDIQDLPDLDRSYTDFVAIQLRKLGNIKVDRDDLWHTFLCFHTSPFYMQQVVKTLMLHRADTLDQARDLVTESILANPQLADRWQLLDTIERAVYRRVCEGKPLYAGEFADELAKLSGKKAESSVIQAALRRLQRQRLVSMVSRGKYRNEDPDLLTWLESQRPRRSRRVEKSR